MKKKLEFELVSIAHRILKLKGKEDVIKMHAEALTLFEKLSVLKFAYENFEGDVPTIENSSVVNMISKAYDSNTVEIIEIEEKREHVEVVVEVEESIEPVKESSIVKEEQIVNKQLDIETVLKESLPQEPLKITNLEDLLFDFGDMPIFDPVPKAESISNKKKSLNDTIRKGGLNIGLNDKLAFIKHLFEGKNEDYERVISQLNSFNSYIEAQQFLIEIVKPDYNDWINKEEVEERFLLILESKFS